MRIIFKSSTSNSKTRPLIAMVLVITLSSLLTSCTSLQPKPDPIEYRHYFDVREELTANLQIAPSDTQREAEQRLRERVGDLNIRYNRKTGAIRSINQAITGLSRPTAGAAKTIAERFVQQHVDLLGLTANDFAHRELLNRAPDPNGATHFYWRQQHHGLAVYNALLQVSVEADGRIRSLNNAFSPAIETATADINPSLPANAAVYQAIQQLGISADMPTTITTASTPDQTTTLEHAGISHQRITAKLMWLPVSTQDVRLVWNFQLHTMDRQHVFDINVDAHAGQVMTRFDWVADATYRVYPQPLENPNQARPLPPVDARQLVTDPHDPVTSPFGWHDDDGIAGAEHTKLRGNNVFAYLDHFNTDSPAGSRTNCGPGLNCDFPLNLGGDPLMFPQAAMTHVFYWSNLFHDIMANHGFDTASGAFQENNYGMAGLGGDPIMAEVQNGWGSGTELLCRDLFDRPVTCRNNATFTTPPDGSPGRLQMQMWESSTGELRDGAYDAGVISHELGHGVTSRLVGGSASASCTAAPTSISEGVSDYFGLTMTQKPSDNANTPRSIATWGKGEPPSGPGIRTESYTLNPARNSKHHERIYDCVTVHCAGEIWGQALWGIHWDLIQQHGYHPDLHDPSGTRGNQRMLNYLVRGLKTTRCRPDLLDARDGMLLSTLATEDVCLVNKRLARFGLGLDAVAPFNRALGGANGHAIAHTCMGDSSDETWIRNPAPRDQGDDFGRAVVIRGDLAAVGAPGDKNAAGIRTGAVYILVRDTTGWRIEAKLTAPRGSAGDRFGTSVDLKGDFLIVGAPRTDLSTARGDNHGQAFVFKRQNASSSPRWEQEGGAIELLGARSGEHFGFSVAINSRRGLAVVGAPHLGGISSPGAAYVFERVGDGLGGSEWVRQGGFAISRSKLISPSRQRDDEFGFSVAFSISGETILIGSPGENNLGNRAGAAHLFTQNPSSGHFRHTARLEGSRQPDAAFGSAVALGNNLSTGSDNFTVAIVGAPRTHVGATRSGAAYLFQEPAVGWASGLTGRMLRPTPASAAGDAFGNSVAISGDHIVVGALGVDPLSPAGNSGAAYLFVRQGRNWNEIRQIRQHDDVRHANFADGVSISAGVIMVGASRDYDTDSGSVFFYE